MSEWHVYDRKHPKGLEDHNYYLVTHTHYGTPMKAKWHADLGGIWEVYGCQGREGYHGQVYEYWYAWDKENPITAWMELPDVYSPPSS